MQLTLHADYGLRVLLYLGSLPPGTVASTSEISRAYGISKHHLVRVVQTLSRHGYVAISGGRAGGVSLARKPGQIHLGEVVRNVEPNLSVVECFDAQTNTCAITPVCRLKPVIQEALHAFLSVMDQYTLADMMENHRDARLAAILHPQPSPSAGRG